METNMSSQLLRDRNIFPTPEVLEQALGKRCCAAFRELIDTVTGGEYGLTFEWRFYDDGKSWLGKATYRRKTVFWLSVYEGFFRTNFYFTEKNRGGVAELSIDDEIKAAFAEVKTAGTMVQLPLLVSTKRQIGNVLEIVKYKKTLK